jgi:hypothetical protein
MAWFYILLISYTAIIFYLARVIWKRTHQISFPIGIALLYYWTLLGSWFFVYDDMSGGKGAEFGLHYYIYLEKMFMVHADASYFSAISYYALFLITIECTILFFLKDKGVEQEKRPIEINHVLLLSGCLLAIVLSTAIIWKQILFAAGNNYSVYTVTRTSENSLFTIHQLLNEVAVTTLYIGLISFLCSSHGRIIKGGESSRIFIFYIVATLLIEGYMLFLGNKREILFGGIFGMVFYFSNMQNRIRWKPVVLIISIVIVPLFFNDALRGYSPTFLTKIFDIPEVEMKIPETEPVGFSVSGAATTFLFSNEMFCANFSMYGAIHYKIPFTYGTSLVYLAASIVPKAIISERPPDIYMYYAEKLKMREGQGYTIHHATGWYLNFGLLGIFAGAFLFGLLWVYFYNKFEARAGFEGFKGIFFGLALSLFTSAIPSLVRGGPEGYKALLFEYLLLPVLAVYFAYSINKLKLFKR